MDVVESLAQFSAHSLIIKHQETREALLAENSSQVRAIDKLGVAGFAYEEVVREGVERFSGQKLADWSREAAWILATRSQVSWKERIIFKKEITWN